METLQIFKFLSTHCRVVQSPTRSPLVIRRKKTTLKMFLTLKSPSRQEQPIFNQGCSLTAEKDVSRRKLRDLFISSHCVEEEEDEEKERRKGKSKEEVLAAMAARLKSFQMEADKTPLWFGFSKRLLKRAWRPKLGTIHE